MLIAERGQDGDSKIGIRNEKQCMCRRFHVLPDLSRCPHSNALVVAIHSGICSHICCHSWTRVLCRCEALAAVGETLENSDAQARACSFLLSKQRADGGWGESYLSSQDKVCSCMWHFVCKRKRKEEELHLFQPMPG